MWAVLVLLNECTYKTVCYTEAGKILYTLIITQQIECRQICIFFHYSTVFLVLTAAESVHKTQELLNRVPLQDGLHFLGFISKIIASKCVCLCTYTNKHTHSQSHHSFCKLACLELGNICSHLHLHEMISLIKHWNSNISLSKMENPLMQH